MVEFGVKSNTFHLSIASCEVNPGNIIWLLSNTNYICPFLLQHELSQSIQTLSEKAKIGTQFIQKVKAMIDKVEVRYLQAPLSHVDIFRETEANIVMSGVN